MSDDSANLREAERIINRLRDKLAESRASRREPIAVIGFAARTPFESQGVEFWEGLSEGIDTSRTIPNDRWDAEAFYDPEKPGASHTKRGNFLSDVVGFDASFFAIAPVEAHAMDPQQRLLLETAWEALADAGAPLPALAQVQTGVFLGGCGSEYGSLMEANELRGALASYELTGRAMSVMAGRISYALGLTGPSLLVDTACSSSLVATHLACESLRSGTSDVALAGGVGLMLTPRGNSMLSELDALSTDGRCRSFDAKGTGFGRGEGCGIVVLKRLSDALRDGDRVLALIRASAVNQDGRSDGLTAPSGPAQQAVLREALEFAKLTPADVQYIEAHGTGTVLGDPIEVEALSEVFSAGHTKTSPLVIGSLKSNIGHLEGAAGIAGLIKLILSIQHRELPASLHFQTPNPHIAWDKIPVRVQKKHGAWPEPDKALIGGVSSFGISGTNAHVIASEAPAEDAEAWKEADRLAQEAKLLPLFVSAKTPEALRAYAKRFADHLKSPLKGAATWRDVAYTSAARRTHLEHRLAVVGANAAEWVTKLEAFANGEARRGLSTAIAEEQRKNVVFVFPGQGSQWLGMGRALLASSPVFREHIDRCEAAFRPLVDWSLRDQLSGDSEKSRLGDIDVVQPTLFAIQTGLAAVWASWGVIPDAVVGHSMGEVAAAFVAGALTLDDAARVICIRSKLLRRVRGRGAMAMLEMTMADVESELASYDGKISVAASNGPRATVVSGDAAAVAALVESLQKREVFCRPVKVDVASHSNQVDELKADLLRELAVLRPTTPSLRFVSTAVIDPTSAPTFDAAYWWANLREPVRLSQRVSELLGSGHELFVELSPHPVLSVGLEETIRAAGKTTAVIASSRRDEPEGEVMLEALGALHAAGYPVNWEKFFGARGRVVPLPSYPWQRQRYWLPISKAAKHRDGDSKWSLVHRHYTISEQAGKHVFELELDIAEGVHSYFADRKVQGAAVVPAAAFVELALEAASVAFEGKVASVVGLQLSEPLSIPDGETRLVQLVVQPEQEGSYTLRFASRTGKEVDAPWTEHARARLGIKADRPSAPQTNLADVQKRCTRAIDVAELYENYENAGVAYGPAFQGVAEAWGGEGEALSRLEVLPKLTEHVTGYVVHPVLLDAAFQAATLMKPLPGQTFVPSSVGTLRVHTTAVPRWAYVKERSSTDAATTVDVLLFDDSGKIALEVEDLRAVPLGRGRDRLDDLLFESAWRSSTIKDGDSKGRWLLLSDEQGVGAALRAWLEARGGEVVTVTRGSGYTKKDATHYEVDPLAPEMLPRLLKEAYGKTGPKKIVNLFGLDTRKPGASLNDETLQRAQELTVTSTLHLTQALAQVGFGDSPRLFLVTRGSQAATGNRDVVFPEQALAWGFAASLAHEMADLKTTLIDLEEGTSPESLGRELSSADDEMRVALRGSDRLVARLTRHRRPNASAGGLRPLKVSTEQGYALDLLEAGRLDSLALRPVAVPKPGPGHVVIKTRASGVDFRDVRIARGESVEPGVTGETGRSPLGREYAGVVFAVGEGVNTVRVGDEVVGMGVHGFDAYVIASSDFVVKKPASLGFEQAAVMPAAVMTALHAIETVGRLRKGERILVHAAADGVWLAAIEYAKHVGAEIYATAATEDQRAYLRTRGVQHVYDSQTEGWAAEVKRDAAGRGVDLVVDSLGGDAALKAISALAPFGRFVELATGDASTGVSKMRNVTVNVMSLSQLLLEHPEAARDLLREAFRLVEAGVFPPLPVETFSISQVADAFERLSRTRRVGKLVVTAEESVMAHDPSHSARITPDKTYLITGGLGGLGLVAASRLVKMGAKHVALMGRSAPSESAKGAIQELEAQGAKVHVVLADVAQRRAVEGALTELSRSAPPVAGLVHAASVAEDLPIPKLSAARTEPVLAPKLAGALALTSLLPDVEMRVYFSSTAGVLGGAGQSPTSAASAFLDAFASHLQASGKPAVSVDWSAVGDAAAPKDTAMAFLMRQGLSSLSASDAADAFERLALSTKAQVLTIPFDVHQWRAANPRVAGLTVLRELFAEGPQRSSTKKQKGSSVVAKLRSTAAAADRLGILSEYLRETVASVLQSSPASVGLSVPFKQLGFDSLMVVRLKNTIERDLAMPVAATSLFGHPTIEKLAAYLGDKFGAPAEAAKPAPARPAAKAPAPPPAKVEARAGDSEELSLAEQLRLGDEELDDE